VKGDQTLPEEGREGNITFPFKNMPEPVTPMQNISPCENFQSTEGRKRANKQADDEFLIPSNVFNDKSNHFAACIVLHISSREANRHRVYAISILSTTTPLPQITYPCNSHHLSFNPLPLPLPHLNPCLHLKQRPQWT
jgi:hypothetical protein